MFITSRFLIVFLAIFAPAYAEIGASLHGAVNDPQGKPLPGAVLTLVSRSGAAGNTTTSDSSGAYQFNGLPPGEYLLRVEAPGFSHFVESNISLGAGTAETRNVEMQLASVREEVVVTASGTPQTPEETSKANSVVEQAGFEARGASFLADVVSLTPSLWVEQLGGPGQFTDIRIRGLRAQDTAVLVDGLRIRDVSSTQADASGITEDLLLSDSNRVEVLRGSGSSLYGTNAIGGVINVITDEGGGRTRGSILLEGGSLGAVRGRLQLSGGMHQDRVQYSLGVQHLNVMDGVDGDQPFRETAGQGRVTFHIAPSVRLIARFFAADTFGASLGEPDIIGSPSGLGVIPAIPLSAFAFRLYQAGTPPSQLNTGNATFIPAPVNSDGTRAGRFLAAALILNGQISPPLDYSISYQLITNSRRYGDGPAGLSFQPAGNTRSLYDGHVQTVDAQVHYRLGRSQLLSGGYEFERETYSFDNSDTSNLASNSGANVTEQSHTVFVQDQVQLLDGRLQISAAARAQYFVLSAPAFIPAASAPYQSARFSSPTPAYTGDGSIAYLFRRTNTKLRAHIGRAYRAPSLYERFGAGYDPTFGYSVFGDPRLKPEHSTGLDGGIDQSFWRGRLRTSASYFYTWLENIINFDTSGVINPATDPFGRFFGYLNTQGGISRGLEFSAAGSPIRSMSVSAGYSYVNALERTPVVGDVLQSFAIPRNQFSIQVTEQATPRLLLTLSTLQTGNYLFPIFGNTVTQTYRFDGIHKVNLGASYRIPMGDFRAVRVFVRVENVFNQTYFASGFLTPGRMATGGAQFEF
jgi:outer membrane cobalamin receptor